MPMHHKAKRTLREHRAPQFPVSIVSVRCPLFVLYLP